MARKLKTFTTSIGFFDLAVAAPSMKAALEAWGAKQNLFHQGFAEETDASDIVAATMAKPGVVLRRAVGTRNAFAENAELPKTLSGNVSRGEPKPRRKAEKAARRKPAPAVHKATVIEFAKAKARRDKEREKEAQREQAAEAREQERREKAVEKAQSVLDRAREHHREKMKQLEKDRQAAEDRIEAERKRWKNEEDELRDKMHRAER